MKNLSFIILLLIFSCNNKENQKNLDGKNVAFFSNSQATNLEFDHFFIFTDNYLAQDTFFKELGFYSKNSHHTGNGTSSNIIYFQNFYLEFISIDDLTAFEKHNAKYNIQWKQNKVLNADKMSPFGVGLHLKDITKKSDFKTFGYHQPWLREGKTIEVAASTNSNFQEPFIFIVPDYLKWNNNLFIYEEYSHLFKNPYDLKRLSKIEIHTENLAPNSNTYQKVLQLENIKKVKDETTFAKIIFDKGAQNKTKDFRPELPLVFEY